MLVIATSGLMNRLCLGGNHDIVFQLDKPVELKMYGLVTGLRLDVPDKWTLYGAESKSLSVL